MIWTLFLNSIAIYITTKILAGVEVRDFWTAIAVAIVLALVNTFIKPVLVFISIPITFLTLGLFTFVIDALLILLVSKLVTEFKVKGFVWAFIFALVLMPINYFLNFFFG